MGTYMLNLSSCSTTRNSHESTHGCRKNLSNFLFKTRHLCVSPVLRLFMMTTNLFVIANVKKLRTGCSFRILLPFFRTSWGVGFRNSAIFNSLLSRVEFVTILEGLPNFGGVDTPTPPPPRSAPLLKLFLH